MRALLSILFLACGVAAAADYPAPVEGDFVMRNFRFASGETLPELRIHYRTVGTLAPDRRNAVLILHGTTGNGASLLRAEFADELFRAGQPVPASRATACAPAFRTMPTRTWSRRSTG
jgi:homoserine O-acetyltransferase